MKFKHLLIIFSIFTILILLITVLLPSFIVGSEFAPYLRLITLPFSILTVLVIIGLSAFFFSNYRLLSLLEREDWPALAYYLEKKIYVKHSYSSRKVKLLASSYMVISDYPSVLKLESKAMIAKPAVVRENALIFGAARVLSGDHASAVSFFNSYLDKCNEKDAQWVRWYYGFTLLLGGAFGDAESVFLPVTGDSDNALITGLSAYFLSNTLAHHSHKPEECHTAAKRGSDRVVKAIKNEESWKSEADKSGTEIHIAIIRKYIDEAGKWLFDDKRNAS